MASSIMKSSLKFSFIGYKSEITLQTIGYYYGLMLFHYYQTVYRVSQSSALKDVGLGYSP